MSEMKGIYAIDSEMNGKGSHGAESASSGRCHTGEQRGPGRHPAASRTGWTKEMNIAVMEYYFLSNPVDENLKPISGYRRRMQSIWNERQSLHVAEQRLCDQVRMMHKNGWLTELQLADIKKRLMNISIEKNENPEIVFGEEPLEENDMVSNNGPMASANILELSDHDRELLQEIKSTKENDLDTELQRFKKLDRSVLREHVQNVNRVLGNIATDNITAKNNLVKACALLIGRKLGLKPSRKGRETKEPWLKRRINQSGKEIRRKINLFDQRIKQYKINRLFHQDQMRVCQRLNGKANNDAKPDADKNIRF